jgi:hypothetical protein
VTRFAGPLPSSRTASSGNRYHLIACPGGRHHAAADDGHVRDVESVAGQAGGDQPPRCARAAAHAQVVEVSFPRDRLPGEGESDRLVYDLDYLGLNVQERQELLGQRAGMPNAIPTAIDVERARRFLRRPPAEAGQATCRSSAGEGLFTVPSSACGGTEVTARRRSLGDCLLRTEK